MIKDKKATEIRSIHLFQVGFELFGMKPSIIYFLLDLCYRLTFLTRKIECIYEKTLGLVFNFIFEVFIRSVWLLKIFLEIRQLNNFIYELEFWVLINKSNFQIHRGVQSYSRGILTSCCRSVKFSKFQF